MKCFYCFIIFIIHQLRWWREPRPFCHWSDNMVKSDHPKITGVICSLSLLTLPSVNWSCTVYQWPRDYPRVGILHPGAQEIDRRTNQKVVPWMAEICHISCHVTSHISDAMYDFSNVWHICAPEIWAVQATCFICISHAPALTLKSNLRYSLHIQCDTTNNALKKLFIILLQADVKCS